MKSIRQEAIGRIYRMRIIGMIVAGVSIASVLYQQKAPVWLWAWLAACSLLWPHVAFAVTRRSANPGQAESRNFMTDAALGSSWIAFMHFNLLPSVVLLAMLSMDHLSIGGWKLLRRALPGQLLAGVIATWLVGFQFHPVSNMLNVVACVPILVIFPAHLSLMTFAMAQDLREQNRKLAYLGRTDSLTRLPNRRAMLEESERELQRYRRNRRPAVIILIDVDGLKQVNDAFGHAAGDALLRKVADVLQKNLREGDIAGRLSGDEFVLLLPETEAAAAHQLAERVRLHAQQVGAEGPGVWTLSMGIAEVTEDIAAAAAWMDCADVALYLAKSQGRNRIEVSASDGAGAPPTPVGQH